MKPPKTILVVEDETSLLNIMYDKLTAEGYSVLKAIDGKEGLDLAIKEQPNLILLDINLPVMDGLTMLKEIRKNESLKNTEVVMLTNFSESKMLAEALQYGAHDYLVKSDWSLDDVVKLVHEKLN
jgi:DNA-binding response OmpR family regulator